ncbi:ATP-binding cassette domain-containing protein [Nocardioides sp. zg-536]|uniref:ABC-type quaternary amine transporter n=1 Tax=Nocardioides faecalis TaxID=2803858 RepID=A0A939BXH7_9ACTN|nr:ATP-binding cassette domain-containing protein [Nocardioides faecalis]MBM9461742.1 ATP-binding cassette domain-containing protein [Nocardioides faecalis]QVI57759.1 ATP-binding cassette domain-containing protein [Nocardioides faecalis]
MGIQFDSVTKTYPDGTVAVRDFSATVESHSTLALVGSSGSGKTTLMRMVNRMVDPTAGTVRIDGRDVRELDKVALRRSIGYVPQAGGLLPHRRVVDNVATVPVLTGTPRRAARDKAMDLLTLVGLEHSLARRFPGQLSGGQQQRVAVARALAAEPEVLLMDEPFGAVDPIVRRDLQDQLLGLQAELGKTIVLVTHDVDEAFRLGDTVIILRTGGVVAQAGTPQEIVAAPADDFVRDFVGTERSERTLSTVEVKGRRLVVDGDGRPVGVLA